MQKKKTLIIVVSAPSGSGKTTIVDNLLEEMTALVRSKSYTTRAPRAREVNGEDYIFVSKEEFKTKVKEGEFLEYEENFGNCYGTSSLQVKEALSAGQDIILSIDVKGARRVKKAFPESISVFIMPPSREVLEERLKNRKTDEKKDVLLRLEEAEREIAARDEYDYLIVNDNLEKAVDELKSIIQAERENKS
ncbi:MAG: guanylate kinase [Candidatus Omnitrophica bacterium]|nr:guanylate kinase [Candidatus Omnitrophota bacterium]